MSKRPIRPKPRKIRRNPAARVLAQGQFRAKVVKHIKTYKRRPKHKKTPEEA